MIAAAIVLALATPPPARAEGQCVTVSDPNAHLGFASVLEEARLLAHRLPFRRKGNRPSSWASADDLHRGLQRHR
jgi:hypothetical protein